jgi:hypothetical protein
MLDVFPQVFATLQSADYFADDLDGFEDGNGNFKVFPGDESPDAATPFITVDVNYGGQSQHTEWSSPFVTFSIVGPNTNKPLLFTIANEIRDIFKATSCFESVGEAASVQYALLGEAVFDEGTNPVTGNIYVSVALRFGLTS